MQFTKNGILFPVRSQSLELILVADHNHFDGEIWACSRKAYCFVNVQLRATFNLKCFTHVSPIAMMDAWVCGWGDGGLMTSLFYMCASIFFWTLLLSH